MQHSRKYFNISKAKVIRYSLENLGADKNSRCIMVGDTKYDAQGAAETGVDFIGCLYGYGTREEMENFYKNAVYASSPAEIRDIII